VTIVTERTAPPGPPLPHRAGMTDAVRFEWSKFWSVRSSGWTLGVTGVAIIGIAALACATGHDMVPDPTRRSLIGFFLGQLTIGVLGVLVMSAEYGTGSIRSTLAAIPRRPVVLGAKIVVLGVITVVVGEALSFVAFFMGQALLAGSGRDHALFSDPGTARAVVGAGLYLALLGLIGLGLATLTRHTAGGLAAYAGVVLVLPIIVGALPTFLDNAISRYLPANIGLTVVSTTASERLLGGAPTFGPWAGLALLVGYALGLLGLGCFLLVRRDA
jgi:ABC-2 type transport system permease protein